MDVDIKTPATVKPPQAEKASPLVEDAEEVNTKEDREASVDSPTNSQKTISDDDEIDYSIKPEFYDPHLDDKDEIWVQKRRKGHLSDATLSCPACFTTLSHECQRHEKYVTQYRAMFVVNCKIKIDDTTQPGNQKRKRGKGGGAYGTIDPSSVAGETIRRVCCSVCSTEVGVIDEEEIYHFSNVLPSEC